MVLFGTGWLDPASDPGSDTQTVYGIWDWQNYWRSNPNHGVDPMAAYYGEFGQPTGGRTRRVSNLDNLHFSSCSKTEYLSPGATVTVSAQ